MGHATETLKEAAVLRIVLPGTRAPRDLRWRISSHARTEYPDSGQVQVSMPPPDARPEQNYVALSVEFVNPMDPSRGTETTGTANTDDKEAFVVSGDAWQDFIEGVKAGEFDLPQRAGGDRGQQTQQTQTRGQSGI